MVVRVASRKYGALIKSAKVTFSPATFRGVKKFLTLDIAGFLLELLLSVTTIWIMKFRLNRRAGVIY
jgi:hypothetical protein